ncbi:30S ribosome-binding factor RbfA [Mycoplasma sp. ATU-Cv-703]
MPLSVNHKRKESLYFQALARILHEQTKGPLLRKITLTGAKLSGDASHLELHYTTLSQKIKTEQALQKAVPFLRSRLAREVNPRLVPQLVFKFDTSLERGIKIDAILENLRKK